MKVGIVTSYLNKVGGVETFNRDLTNLLMERGHEVKKYGIESLERISEDVPVEKQVGDYFNRVNETEKFDVVLCNGEFGYSVDHPKSINLFHGNYYGYAMALKDLVEPEVTQSRLDRAQLQKISAEGKKVVAVSNLSKSQLESFGIPVDAVINNSADTNIFYPTEGEVGNSAIAVSRGRYYEKGLDVIKRLGDRGVNIRLFSDMEIDSPGIQNMGFIKNEDLREEYNKSKILLFPSRFEGGPLTPLEAMACGCPIITTPAGYGVDIKNEINNFVAENFDEFFVKTYLVMNEREKYSKLALDYFNEFHNPDKFKKEWVDIIEGM